MKVAAIIQARMGSTRLPGKILAPLAGIPLLKVIHQRIRTARVDSFWLATSIRREDNLTAYWGQASGLKVYRGHVEDVLSRFTAIIRKEQPDWVLRLTGDNPFVDADILDRLIAKARGSPQTVGYIHGGENGIFPLGYAPEIVRSECLLEAESKIGDREFYHRSHVTSWIKNNTDIATLKIPQGYEDRSLWRWTIDTHNDYRMATMAFDLFGEHWAGIGYAEMVEMLDNHPEVPEINLNIRQKRLEEG